MHDNRETYQSANSTTLEKPMTGQRITIDNPRLHLLAIILLTFVFYAGTFNNFFYADDFIWLDRVKHLAGNWSSIFNVENRYFTPLTYLSFFASYKLFGLNPFWYHLHDAVNHAGNGILLYLLAYQVSRSRLTSFVAAVVFVTSSSILITVLWPSARTDLIMVFFSLATISAFVRGKSAKYKYVPLGLYVLALCAKGTALVIPLVLFLLTENTKPLKSRVGEVLPYVAINAVYATLLALSNSFGASKIVPTNTIISLINYARALPSLIVPERHLSEVGTPLLAVFCVTILLVMLVMAIQFRDITLRIGTALAVAGLLPLLFTRDYALAGNKATALNLLSSPSNRVYLAAAGISLVYAALFAKLMHGNRHLPARISSFLLLALLLCANYYEIHHVNTKWAKGTEGVRHDLAALERNASLLTENSVLLLFNFEGSTGFSKAMINTFYDLNAYEVHTVDRSYTEELTDADRSPLNNPLYDNNAAHVKLIMDCPGNLHADSLVRDGNLVLQDVLADYRELYATNIPAEMRLIRNRLDGNMSKFRSALNSCFW